MRLHVHILLLPLIVLRIGAQSDAPRCSDDDLFATCWTDRIGESIDMFKGVDTARYNCSAKSVTEWYSTGQVRIGLGLYYILSGLVFQLLGWPVLHIFLTKGGSKQYKLMIFIGIIECTEVWGVSIWPGYAGLRGDVYCTSRVMSTIVGKVTMVQWITGTTAVIFLGIHRLLDLSKSGSRLCNSNRSLTAWMLAFGLYGVWGSFCFDTVLFNSALMAPLLDPRIETASSFVYSNSMLRVHNTVFAALLVLVYTSIVVVWYCYRQYRYSTHYFTAMQRSILIQSIAISVTYAPPALCFVAIYFIDNPSHWIVLVSDLSYQISGGLPFIVILSLNKAVRRHFRAHFNVCLGSTNVSTVHTITTQMTNQITMN